MSNTIIQKIVESNLKRDDPMASFLFIAKEHKGKL